MLTQNGSLANQLLAFGMINRFVYGGIQIDIGRVKQTASDGTTRDGQLCDHNCTTHAPTRAGKGKGSLVVLEPTGGNYLCPSSSTLNHGMDPHGFAPADTIVGWVRGAVQGHGIARVETLTSVFPNYQRQFCISDEAEEALREGMLTPGKTVEVNIFGGNPEMHPEAAEIIQKLRNLNLVVNFTTTGRRLMRDAKFFEAISQHPPNMFAFSIDDLTAEDILHLGNISLWEVHNIWQETMRKTPNHGQRLKAIEGVYAARALQEARVPVTILFNMVIHPGNLKGFRELLAAIAQIFPKALCNPYNVQSSFEMGTANYTEIQYSAEQLADYKSLNDWLIDETVAGNPNITKRLHFYLFMKAIFMRWKDQPQVLSKWISGHEGWKCYKAPGAGRYLQIGGSPLPWDNSKQHPGGHRGCFWNDRTVTEPVQMDNDFQDTANYLIREMSNLGQNATNACPGCIMPRLMFDVISTELGMNDQLIPAYLQLRKKYAGY